MNANKRPISVTIVACVYLAVGTLAFVYHFRELLSRQPDSVGMELTEFLAVVCGVFMLRGHNWARWLALAWIAFHVILSVFDSGPRIGCARFAVCGDCLDSLSSRGCAIFSRPAAIDRGLGSAVKQLLAATECSLKPQRARAPRTTLQGSNRSLLRLSLTDWENACYSPRQTGRDGPLTRKDDNDVDLLQGTLDLLVLKAVSLGPLHGYGVLLRIQQISGDRLEIQQGSLYPALYRLEHEGWIAGEWGESENKRRARFYKLTAAGRRRLDAEAKKWNQFVDADGIDSQGEAGGAMRLRSRISTWWRAVSRGRELDRQIGEELEFHIESYAEDLVRRGLPRDEAMRRARAELGSIAARKENCRSAWGTRIFDELRGDLRFAMRMLAKSPGLAAIAIGSLALGIGANTVIFTVAKHMLLDRLGVPASRAASPAVVDGVG